MKSKQPTKVPKAPSKGEALLQMHLDAYGIAMEREYRFDDKRRWRLDFADPLRKLGIEVEGGTWSGGRHTRGKGFEEDCRKYATATIKGWAILRFTTGMIETGEAIDWIRSALTL